jgi:putative transposase
VNLPKRSRLPHAVPNWVPENERLIFITINCLERGRNQLCKAGIGDQIFAAAEFNNFRRLWGCRLMLLMPDHVHAITFFPLDPGLKTIVTNWKTYLAKKYRIGWQRDFFDHRIRNHDELKAKSEYILMNPVRRGLCERAEDWPWVWRPKTASALIEPI